MKIWEIGTENPGERMKSSMNVLRIWKRLGSSTNTNSLPKGLNVSPQRFGDADAARYWLTVPNDALDGAEPLALLREGEVARIEAATTGYLQGDFV